MYLKFYYKVIFSQNWPTQHRTVSLRQLSYLLCVATFGNHSSSKWTRCSAIAERPRCRVRY